MKISLLWLTLNVLGSQTSGLVINQSPSFKQETTTLATSNNNITNVNQAKKLPIIPYIDYNDLIFYRFNQEYASDITYDDLFNYLGNNVLYQVCSTSDYNSFTNVSQLRLINFIDDQFNGTLIDYLNQNFKPNPEMFYNDDLGLIKVRLNLKPKTTVKYIPWAKYSTDNTNFSLNKKVYTVNNYIEFALVNFKNVYTLNIDDQFSIDANKINLGNYNANELTTDIIVNNLMQFQDSEILPVNGRILLTNYNKALFLAKYNPQVEVLSSTWGGINCFCKLSINLFNQINDHNIDLYNVESNNSQYELTPIKTDVLYFSINNLKNEITINQVKTNYDISTNTNFSKLTASEFTNNFESNILNLINYYNDQIELKYPLFTTNLTRREFSSLNIHSSFGEYDDINGTINNCVLEIDVPINSDLNQPKYETKSFKFSLFNFHKKIDVYVNQNPTFDVSKLFNLNSLTADQFNIDYLLNNLVEYETSQLNNPNAYLFATNLNMNGFKQLIQEVNITNVLNNTGELDLSIKFNSYVNINDINTVNYHLYGFKQNINILQTTKTIDFNELSFLDTFNSSLNENMLVNNSTNKQLLTNLIIENYNQLFLFNADQTIEAKIFSINCSEAYFSSHLADWANLQVNILANLGIINIKLYLQNVNGVKVNNNPLNNTNNYLEFNIAGYYKDFSATLITDKLSVDYKSLSGFNIDQLNNQYIIKTFIGLNNQTDNNSLIQTSLDYNEVAIYFINNISVDKSAINTLGIIDISIDLNQGFIDNNIQSLQVTLSGFSVDENQPLVYTNKNQIDISNSNLNQLTSDQLTINEAFNYIGFDGVPNQNKAYIFSCSSNIFSKYLYQNCILLPDSDKCKVTLNLNNSLKPNIDNQLSFSLVGFKVINNWWIILISVIGVLILISLIAVFIILWLKRKKVVKEINNEKQWL